jgi:hypothetical protein
MSEHPTLTPTDPTPIVHGDLVVNLRGRANPHAAGRVYTFTTSTSQGYGAGQRMAGIDLGAGTHPTKRTAGGFPRLNKVAWAPVSGLVTVLPSNDPRADDLFNAALVVMLAPYIRRALRATPDPEFDPEGWAERHLFAPGGARG